MMTSLGSLPLMFCYFVSSVFFSNFSFCSSLAFSKRTSSSYLFSLSCSSCSSISFLFGLCFDIFDCLLNHTNTLFNFFALLYDLVLPSFCLKVSREDGSLFHRGYRNHTYNFCCSYCFFGLFQLVNFHEMAERQTKCVRTMGIS